MPLRGRPRMKMGAVTGAVAEFRPGAVGVLDQLRVAQQADAYPNAARPGRKKLSLESASMAASQLPQPFARGRRRVGPGSGDQCLREPCQATGLSARPIGNAESLAERLIGPRHVTKD